VKKPAALKLTLSKETLKSLAVRTGMQTGFGINTTSTKGGGASAAYNCILNTLVNTGCGTI
jgi:hypothetical protein